MSGFLWAGLAANVLGFLMCAEADDGRQGWGHIACIMLWLYFLTK